MNMQSNAAYNEFEKFISHSDFARVLELSHFLKQQKSSIDENTPLSLTPQASMFNKQSLSPNHFEKQEDIVPFDESAAYVRSSLIVTDTDTSPPVMQRGMCASTDSLIDETIVTLASELRLVLSLKKQMVAAKATKNLDVDDGIDSGHGEGKNDKEGEDQAIDVREPASDTKLEVTTKDCATKFTKAQTDVLIQWMIDNIEHPYLSIVDIDKLTKATGLLDVQVTNWVGNARKRNGKAVIEGVKKPYHFLDYLFLATDREKHQKTSLPGDSTRNTLELKDSSEESTLAQLMYQHLDEVGTSSSTRSPAMFSEFYLGAKTPVPSSSTSGAHEHEGLDSPFDEAAADYVLALHE